MTPDRLKEACYSTERPCTMAKVVIEEKEKQKMHLA
jgi:hypothetical protein